jgi:septal ring factor EnvC (AmiA/AmiB activator)
MLETRVAHLEEDMKELKADVKTVVRDLGTLRQDLAYLRGRVENLPTTWVLLTSITASQAALLGFTFAMLRLFMPHT